MDLFFHVHTVKYNVLLPVYKGALKQTRRGTVLMQTALDILFKYCE